MKIIQIIVADYIQDILSRKAQVGKSSVSQSIYNFKNASNMLIFLQQNQIMDMTGLDEKFSSMLDEQMDIRDKLTHRAAVACPEKAHGASRHLFQAQG